MTQTPLEQLRAANEEAGKRRRRSARRRHPTEQTERFYRAQLTSLVAAMNKALREEVLPVVSDSKSEYTLDAAVPTFDTWSERIIAALRAVAARFLEGAMEGQYQRIAQRTVSMQEAASTSAFLRSANEAAGVDLTNMLDEEGMREYINIAVEQNVELIKSVPQEYFRRIENTVLGGVRAGDGLGKIRSELQQQAGITRRRAQLIARDQVAKLNGEITEHRQRKAGIKYFRWSHSNDGRVGDDHRVAASRDVGYGRGVYRWDRPPREGIPGHSARPNCRCTAIPVFEWELPRR